MFGLGKDRPTAEDFIREQTALYRHYSIDEVQASVEQFTGVSLTDEEAIELVQDIRDENGLGMISDYNLPGYVDKDNDAQGNQSGGSFFGWFRR